MSSLWWLCAAQWRRGKSRVRREGREERGQGGIAPRLQEGRGAGMAKAKGGKRVLRKG